MWSTSEHFVSCAHVRQRHDGTDLWDDSATFEQSRNRAEPRRRDFCVEECRADIRTRGHEVRGNDRDEKSARFRTVTGPSRVSPPTVSITTSTERTTSATSL